MTFWTVAAGGLAQEACRPCKASEVACVMPTWAPVELDAVRGETLACSVGYAGVEWLLLVSRHGWFQQLSANHGWPLVGKACISSKVEPESRCSHQAINCLPQLKEAVDTQILGKRWNDSSSACLMCLPLLEIHDGKTLCSCSFAHMLR